MLHSQDKLFIEQTILYISIYNFKEYLKLKYIKHNISMKFFRKFES